MLGCPRETKRQKCFNSSVKACRATTWSHLSAGVAASTGRDAARHESAKLTLHVNRQTGVNAPKVSKMGCE